MFLDLPKMTKTKKVFRKRSFRGNKYIRNSGDSISKNSIVDRPSCSNDLGSDEMPSPRPTTPPRPTPPSTSRKVTKHQLWRLRNQGRGQEWQGRNIWTLKRRRSQNMKPGCFKS